MNDDSFRKQHPFLYHLRSHPREYSALALAFVTSAWVCTEVAMVTARLNKTFSFESSVPQDRLPLRRFR